jgi:hypothetical protein
MLKTPRRFRQFWSLAAFMTALSAHRVYIDTCCRTVLMCDEFIHAPNSHPRRHAALLFPIPIRTKVGRAFKAVKTASAASVYSRLLGLGVKCHLKHSRGEGLECA